MTEQLVNVSPDEVLADDNSRFNLKDGRIEGLASSILENGGVLTPIELEPLVPAQGKKRFRLTAGFYRYAAVVKLNAEQKAGLTLPAIVRENPDDLVRLRHQLAENMERENQSPMDRAVAIKKLLDAGVTRAEVRRIFSAAGGRKANVVQPMSNAMLNITLNLLDLPKAIQTKIHHGLVGIAAAYELGKVPPERRAAVLERAEADRLSQVEKEEKDEERYLHAEKKLGEAQEKEKATLSQVETTKIEIAGAVDLVKTKKVELDEVRKAPGYLEMSNDEKKGIIEKMKALDADLKAAMKLEKDAKNKLAKLLGQAKTAAETAEEQKAKLEAARKAKPVVTTKRAVGPSDVKKAAKAEGVESGFVALNLSNIRESLKDVMTNKDYPKVSAIAKVFKDCFDGQDTPKEVIYRLAVITGEVVDQRAQAGPKATAAAKK